MSPVTQLQGGVTVSSETTRFMEMLIIKCLQFSLTRTWFLNLSHKTLYTSILVLKDLSFFSETTVDSGKTCLTCQFFRWENEHMSKPSQTRGMALGSTVLKVSLCLVYGQAHA